MQGDELGRIGRLHIGRLHRTGVHAARVLMIADAAVLDPSRFGAGRWLPDLVADRVAIATGRGVDLDVLWDLKPVLEAVRGAFDSWRLWRYEVVVAVLNDTPPGPAARLLRRQFVRLIAEVLGQVSENCPVVSVLVPPAPRLAGRHASTGPGLERLVTDELPVVDRRLVWLTAPLHPTTSGAEFDTVGCADLIVDELTRGAEWRPQVATRDDRDFAVPEPDRQHAVDENAAGARLGAGRLEQVATIARDAFGASNAEVNLIDRDRIVRIASTGSHDDVPREKSICNLTVRSPEPFVVLDTALDPRFAGNSMMQGPGGVRFYAGHPIESLDGYRIGTLCVWDQYPRNASDVDVTLLRDLALLAEAEIIDPRP